MIKKILYIFLGMIMMTAGTAYALPFFSSQKTLIPSDNNQDLGTTTTQTGQGTVWRNVYIAGSDGCLQLTSGLINSTGIACGSGGGGSGGGTWGTTTSSVTGRLINYSLNTTDIVSIGGTATSTGATEYWFDPNTQNAHIGSSNTASTSVMGLFLLPTVGQGFLYGGTGGNVNAIASSSIKLSWFNNDAGFITTDSTASSTLLSDTNFWSGRNTFSKATSTVFGVGDTYAISSAGMNLHANNGTDIAIFGAGNTANATFYGGINIDGTTRLATSLTGLAKLTSGTVSTASAGTDYVAPATTITINGTANQITSSAGAQDLSANRTWTLSFPNQVIFPQYASSTSGFSTPYASSTNQFVGFLTFSTTTAGTLKVNSSGLVYSDTSGGSGTPAGSNGQLQYNASGAFGGVSTTTASCTGSVSCTGFTIIGSSPITITGSGGSGGGLGTTTPWTYGNIVTAITDGNVTTISTSTLVNNIFPFNSFGNSTSSIFNFTNGLMAFSSTTLNGLKLSDLSQGALYVGSGAKVSSTATSTQTVGSSLSYTGTQGSMLGGSSGTLSLNTANPNTWSVLQTFNYSSSTAYSSFLTASSTFYQGAGLSTCNSASSALTWSGGTFGCNSITGGSGASPDWQKITDPFNVTALTPTTTIPLYIQGTATSSFAGKMVIGSSTGSYANCFLCVTGKENSFMQFNIQNLSGGSSASSDIVATADVGADNKYYLNTGINGSAGASAPFTTSLEGYLYTSDSALNIGALGTTSSSAILKFYTGSSTTTPTERLRITSTGSLVLATTTRGILRTDSSGTIYASSATTTLPLFNGFTNPDTGGNSWIQPSIINAPASIYGGMVYIASSTSAKTGFYGSIHIPSNFASSTSQISIGWTATSTSNSVVFDFDYRCVGGTNTTSLYQTSWQESTTTTVANPSTAGFRKLTTLDINTGYWCTPDSTMEFYVARDGADSADTSTVDLEIYDASILLPTQ